MPGFVQIMEIKTSRADELDALMNPMQEEHGDELLATRSIQASDRDRDGYYFAIIEFDSYEEARKNSNSSAGNEFAGQLAALLDEPPKFYDLDLVRRWEK